MIPRSGAPFHAEFSGFGPAGAPFLFYVDGGVVEYSSGLTLPADVQCIITDFFINASTGGAIVMFDGSNVDDVNVDAGELIAKYNANVSSQLNHFQWLVTPHYCKVGTKPKVTCALQVDVVLRGRLLRIGS